MRKTPEKITLHQISVLKVFLNYFMAFWMYLALWMLFWLLLLYGFISLVEWLWPANAKDILTDPLLAVLLYTGAVGFFVYLFFIYRRKQKFYSGLIVDLKTEEDDSDSSEPTYRHFVKITDKGSEYMIRLDPASFNKLKIGMRVEMHYDRLIVDAKRIVQVKNHN